MWVLAQGSRGCGKRPRAAPFRGHTSYVTSCAYSPDGRRVLSGSRDRKVHVYSADAPTPVAVVYGAASFGCVSRSGRYLVAGDGLGNLWWLELSGHKPLTPLRHPATHAAKDRRAQLPRGAKVEIELTALVA
jgi:WD40 repeat protein